MSAEASMRRWVDGVEVVTKGGATLLACALPFVCTLIAALSGFSFAEDPDPETGPEATWLAIGPIAASVDAIAPRQPTAAPSPAAAAPTPGVRATAPQQVSPEVAVKAEDPADDADPAPRAEVAEAGKGRAPMAGAVHKGQRCDAKFSEIRSEGADKWTVDRELVKSYQHDLKKLESLGWATPHEGPDGSVDGYVVHGLRCGNPLQQGGLRNGDVVHAVNGKPVHSVFQAWGAWRALARSRQVDVVVTRRGQDRVLAYTIL